MQSFRVWFHKNKTVLLSSLVIVVASLVFVKPFLTNRIPLTQMTPYDGLPDADGVTTQELAVARDGSVSKMMVGPDIFPPNIPPTDQQDRLVITETSLSLVVKDVSDSIKQISLASTGLGGFLISSNVELPEEGGTGFISIRVPSQNLAAALEKFKGFGVKVVSESVSGQDVTDQFVDIEARLEILNRTKASFEEILSQAQNVQDLLQVQQQLIYIQDQIDALRGQQEFLKKSAALSRITVYLSTDELSLPYAPSDQWRPRVVFRQAVRSLVRSLRAVTSGTIWIAVFAPAWIPVVVFFIIIRKKISRA